MLPEFSRDLHQYTSIWQLEEKTVISNPTPIPGSMTSLPHTV